MARQPAWAGRPPARESARRRLIEATEECVRDEGIRKVSVASVAKRAGVSRPTVYAYFKNREDLLLATVSAVLKRFSDDARSFAESHHDAATLAVESVLYTCRMIPTEPALAQMWGVSEEGAVLDATLIRSTTSRRALANAAEMHSRLISLAGWSEEEALVKVELTNRITLTMMVSPGPHESEEEMRIFLWRTLVPALGLRSSRYAQNA